MTPEEILKEALQRIAPSSYEHLTRFIIEHPDTDAITFNQLKEFLSVYVEQETNNKKEALNPERVITALKKSVKERTEIDHLVLIRYAHSGSVRNYLLSMGEFKNVPINEGTP
jgi:hypothetical protein